MDYAKYFFSMTKPEQDRYAKASGTNGVYLRTHIFVPAVRRKIPRKDLITSLTDNTNGKCTITDVLTFLYTAETGKAVA